MDCVRKVLRALKRMRPWPKIGRDALAQLIGDVERKRTRIRSRRPGDGGLAGGSGAGAVACTHGIHSRFKRAGLRWKRLGFLHVLALRMARLNGTFQALWAGRGLTIQASGQPTT
jgi:hypothetical protein